MSTHTTQTWVATGRVAAAPKLRETGSGKAVCNFTLLIDRSYPTAQGTRKEVDSFPVTVWGDEARNQAKYLRAGSLVYIKGYVKNRKWQDSQGNVHFGFEIIPQDIEWLSNINSTSDTVEAEVQLDG